MPRIVKHVADVIYLLGSIMGATIVALNIGQAQAGYIVFLFSSFAGLYLLLKSNASRSLLAVHIMFMAINVLGIVRG